MIICSCNVLSEAQVRAALVHQPHPPKRVLAVHHCLGHRPKCGCCAVSILRLIRESEAAGHPCDDIVEEQAA